MKLFYFLILVLFDFILFVNGTKTSGTCDDPNAIWQPCASTCQKVCGEKQPDTCPLICTPGCECKENFIKDKTTGKCIPEILCKDCRNENEEWVKCGTHCPETCNQQGPQACIASCKIGCQCKSGYILDKKDGACIPKESCPKS